MTIKILCCKSKICRTDILNVVRLKNELNRPNIEFLEVYNLCCNLEKLNNITGDIVLVGCHDNVLKNRLNENDKKIVFAPIREECTWVFQEEDKVFREVLLQIKLAVHRLKFKKQIKNLPLSAFNDKLEQYIKNIHRLGPNPFKC